MVDVGRIFPFSQTGSQTSYMINDVCEHTLLTTCRDSDDFTINIDYSEGTLNIDRVGIKYNESTIVMIKEPFSVELKGLGDPISQSGRTTEYANQIFITERARRTEVDLRRLGVRVICTPTELRIETSSGTLSGDLCGLCGRLNGQLVYSDRTTVADINNPQEITQLTNSWRALPVDMFLRDEAREECGKELSFVLTALHVEYFDRNECQRFHHWRSFVYSTHSNSTRINYTKPKSYWSKSLL